jgi:hypothetical protein
LSGRKESEDDAENEDFNDNNVKYKKCTGPNATNDSFVTTTLAL